MKHPDASASPLGTLRVETVLDQYDGPILFVARNELNYAYLVMLVEETEGVRRYLYKPVSETRLAAILSGLVLLRDAFDATETDVVFDVTPPATVARIRSADLPDEWLPDDDDVLDERVGTAQP